MPHWMRSDRGGEWQGADASFRTGRPLQARTGGSALYAWGILTLVNALSQMDRSVLSLVLPLIKRDMMLSDTAMGLLSGLTFTLFYSTLGVPIAWAADRWSRLSKRIKARAA